MYQFRILYYVELVLPTLTSSWVCYVFITDCKKLEGIRFGWPPVASFVQYFVQIDQKFERWIRRVSTYTHTHASWKCFHYYIVTSENYKLHILQFGKYFLCIISNSIVFPTCKFLEITSKSLSVTMVITFIFNKKIRVV